MRIIFAGIIGRHPWGGVSWCSMMYMLALKKLGHDVYYLEDTCECNFDPDQNAIATEPDYALRYINECLEPFGFGDRWCYVDYRGVHHGISETSFQDLCKSTELFLVLSGGCWKWRDHYRSIPRKVFIDSDPGFTQFALDEAMRNGGGDEHKSWYVDFFRTYDSYFSFGSNIGAPECTIPDCGLKWHHTWQPIDLDLWKPEGLLPPRNVWTTVMTWQIESFEDIGGNKDVEFLNVLDLAKRCQDARKARLELAVNGPRDFLSQHGWNCVDAFAVSRDPWRYHSYLSSSRAEFSVAKHTYVRSYSGWFSDRTECYLASGRPAVVQETGFSNHLPVGQGLLSWRSAEEAFAAIEEVEAHYDRHGKHAREVAAEHFRAEQVVQSLLDHIP